MTKSEIKEILKEMITPYNKEIINSILLRLEQKTEEEIEKISASIGNDRDSIRKAILQKIKQPLCSKKEFKHINEMFTYGISGNTIHLHMPINLKNMIDENGRNKIRDMVYLSFLEAIGEIRRLSKEGGAEFSKIDTIYMISPLVVPEMKFLKELSFKTKMYSKGQLKSFEFVLKNPEAILAINIFGTSFNVGVAKISLDVMKSEEWGKMLDEAIQQLRKLVELGELGEEK